MTIMAIIAAAILGTAAAAIEGSREKKTQSQIAKIHTLLMERYASYETRRIDVDPRITQAIDGGSPALRIPPIPECDRLPVVKCSPMRGCLALRELMKKEMPDR